MKISVQHLTKIFGKAKAVDDLSFSFASGDVVGFVGPNGAGKTTTMNIMATLDEPTAGLDPRGRDTILGLIRNYREETGRTVMIVSHSMDDVAEIATKVLVINNARVAMYGTVPEIYARSEELVSMGLDIPQVTKIFLGLKENGIPVRTDVYTVEQARAQLRELREKGVLAW